jgi:hypothetical protein
MTQRLIATVQSDDRMIALLALGSTADESRVDHWSDHDFWVVASAETVEQVRDDRSWLPDHEKIAGWFVETEHGRSAVYPDGHLLEYAVFSPEELNIATANDYRVLVGGDEIRKQMLGIVAKTHARTAEGRSAQTTPIGRLVVHLIIGLGRYGRGEALSANEQIRGHALSHLVGLLGANVESANDSLLDNLDPFRRFEFVHPELAGRLGAALQGPIPELVETYLELIDRHLSHLIGDDGLEPVRRLLQRARAADIGQPGSEY